MASDNIRRQRFLIYIGASLSWLLCGCDNRPAHAAWRVQCVESHTNLIPMTQYIPNGRGGGTTMIQLMPISTCDRSAPVCVAGKDGSTRCPPPSANGERISYTEAFARREVVA